MQTEKERKEQAAKEREERIKLLEEKRVPLTPDHLEDIRRAKKRKRLAQIEEARQRKKIRMEKIDEEKKLQQKIQKNVETIPRPTRNQKLNTLLPL